MTPKKTARLIAGGTAIALIATSFAMASPATAAKKKAKKKFKVTATASASTVKTSHTVTISGKVSPASRATVKLQRYAAGKWVSISSKKLSKASKYSFTVNVGKTATTQSYRVSKAKSKARKAGVSKTLKVRVVTWGTVKAWGSNYDGALGTGNLATPLVTAPVAVKGLAEVTKVAGNNSGTFALALRHDKTVWAWGDNDSGQLGTGAVGPDVATPVRTKVLTNVKDIAAAGEAGYALRTDGTVWAWGSNDSKQLGREGADSGTPAKVAGLTNVKAIAAGYGTVYALKNDGTVWSWGYNGNGDLGHGVMGSPVATPGKVVSLPKITSIAAAADTGYAVGTYGTVYAWGYNSDGELGDGTTQYDPTPGPVAGLSGVTSVGTNYDGAHAIANGGIVFSWGWNSNGVLGTGSVESEQLFPVRIPNLAGIRAVVGGDSTSYALTSTGRVHAWGRNGDGELGKGGPAGGNSYVPLLIPGLTGVKSLGASQNTGYAVIG